MGVVFLGVLSFMKYNGEAKAIPKSHIKEDILASCKLLGKENITDLEIVMEKVVKNKLFVMCTFKNGDGWNYLGGATYTILDSGKLKSEGTEINQFEDKNIDKMSGQKNLCFTEGEPYYVYYGINPNGKTQAQTVQMEYENKLIDKNLEGKGKAFIEVFTTDPDYNKK